MTPSASQVIKKTEKQEETKQDDKKENQISIFKEVT